MWPLFAGIQARTQDFWKAGDKISHEHIFYFNCGQKSYYNKLRKSKLAFSILRDILEQKAYIHDQY